MTRVEEWIRAESLGQNGLPELDRVRETGKRVLAGQ